MPQLKTFIPPEYRPEIISGRLDKEHRARLFIQWNEPDAIKELQVNAIVFGPKKDQVLLSLEHAIEPTDKILIFYYEDIHKSWSYCRTNQENYFLFQKNDQEVCKVKAHCLYIRGCQVGTEDPAWRILGEFYSFIDVWEGKVLCSPRNQNNNESKLYQLSQSIRKACIKKRCISIGKSYVIKWEKRVKKLPKNKSYIVKSLSGTRSIVVDEGKFSQWNQSTLNHLPALFQERANGNDLRVHILNGKLYGKFSVTKDNVDYRYDNQFFSLEDYTNFSKEFTQFCKDLAFREDNQFLGIDFIKTAKEYVVLEANPSPGWSAYYPCHGVKNDAFVNDLILELKHV